MMLTRPTPKTATAKKGTTQAGSGKRGGGGKAGDAGTGLNGRGGVRGGMAGSGICGGWLGKGGGCGRAAVAAVWWLRRRLAAFHCAVGHAGERIPRTHIDAIVFWLLVTLLLNAMQPRAHKMRSGDPLVFSAALCGP